MKRAISLAIAIILAVSLLLPLLPAVIRETLPSEPTLRRFASYRELVRFVESRRRDAEGWLIVLPVRVGAESLPQYSLTNVQVSGVDEADIVKTDGRYAYVVYTKPDLGKGVAVLRVYPPEEAWVLSRITWLNHIWPRELLVSGDRMVVFLEKEEKRVELGTGEAGLPLPRLGGRAPVLTRLITWITVAVYDLSDRANPVLVRNVTVEGRYLGSRMIGNYAYAVTHCWIGMRVETPRVQAGLKEGRVSPWEILYSPVTKDPAGFTTILAVNIHDDREEVSRTTVLMGDASHFYASTSNLYVTFYDYQSDTTLVHRAGIDGGKVEFNGMGSVRGRVLDQFSMDEHGGYFRVATTSVSGGTNENNVYVLDGDLKVIGRLEGFAPSETIYSTRFMGGRCYLVTFRDIDPFFVIDLKDPREPRILGWLKIPGYSDYLHPYDENRVIGIGKEVVVEKGTDFTWFQGLKISLFDVTDVENPKEVAKIVIGDRGTTSPVLRDMEANHKALLFDADRGLLVLPVYLHELKSLGAPPWEFGKFVWQGAYVLDVTAGEISVRGRITHVENGDLWDTVRHVVRSFYVGDFLYTVSGSLVKVSSIGDLAEVRAVRLW